jgi:hypothetical protein
VVEDCLRLPILRLLRQKVAAFNQQNAQPALPQRIGQRPAAHARADDDQIEC